MVFLRFSYGIPMVFLWISFGIPMVSYGNPMIFQRYSCGIPMVVLWYGVVASLFSKISVFRIIFDKCLKDSSFGHFYISRSTVGSKILPSVSFAPEAGLGKYGHVSKLLKACRMFPECSVECLEGSDCSVECFQSIICFFLLRSFGFVCSSFRFHKLSSLTSYLFR